MGLPKPKSPSAFDWRKGNVAVIKEGWEDAGQELRVLGPAIFHYQWWVPIIDEKIVDEPTFFKESALEKRR